MRLEPKRRWLKRNNPRKREDRPRLLERLEDRLLLASDWRNPVDALDVNNDRAISPFDALLVINDLNRSGARLLPETREDTSAPLVDVDGDGHSAPSDVLHVINALTASVSPYILTDGAASDSTRSIHIGLGQERGTRQYTFSVDASFDNDIATQSRDRLEVYLVDPHNPRQTLLDGGEAGTPFFVMEGKDARYPESFVQFDGSLVHLDLTSLHDLAEGKLQFRLVDSDSESGTRVTIKPLSNDVRAGVLVTDFLAVPGTDSEFVELSANWVRGSGSFEEIGLILLDGPSGAVDGVSPDTATYFDTIRNSSQRRTLFTREDGPGALSQLTYSPGDYIGIYVLHENLTIALPDEHLRVLAYSDTSWDIGWEESPSLWPGLSGVGDRGHDDAVIRITAMTQNSPLELLAIDDQVVDEHETFRLTAAVSDSSATLGEVTFSLDQAPTGAQIDATSGEIVWETGELDGPADHPFTVRAASEAGSSSTESFVLTVREVNRPPVLNPISDLATPMNATATLEISAEDPDDPANRLIYSLDPGAPPGASINPTTGRLTWTPTTIGATEVTVRVTDDGVPPLSDSQIVRLEGTCAATIGSQTEESGGSATGRGTVSSSGCDLQLIEGDSFVVALVHDFLVPDSPSSISFTFDDLRFDTDDPGFVNDAFEAALLDQFGNSLVHTHTTGRDAFFNITEGMSVASGNGVSIDGQTVTVGLNGLLPQTEARLVLRLVNNDSDTDTTVTITDLRLVDSPLRAAPPGGKSSAALSPDVTGPSAAGSHSALDLARFADVTGSFSDVYFRTSFNDQAKLLHVDLATQNEGQFGVGTPLLVGVKNISDPRVSVVGADGRLPDGTPYFDYGSHISGNRLDAGQSTDAPTISFHNPNRIPFDYELIYLAQLNQPPVITTQPQLEAPYERLYSYDVDAIDPNDDTLIYQLWMAPVGMAINAQTGEITWTPTVAQRGLHDVLVEVSDRRGGTDRQQFAVEVADPPPNRPPIITSTPVTKAQFVPSREETSITYESEWKYQVVAFDALPDFQDPDFDDAAFATGRGGFGSVGSCELNRTARNTDWPVVTDILLRREIELPSDATQLTVSGAIDNDIQIYLNGVEISQGLQTAEGCAERNEFSVSAPDNLLRSGRNVVAIRARDRGAVAYVDARVTVRVPDGLLETSSGAVYRYDVNSIDPDDDVVAYQLLQAPVGMTIDPVSGLIRWTPTVEQIGDHKVAIEVSDGRGGTARQDYIVCVHADPENHPPVIVSQPVTSLRLAPPPATTLYEYQVAALDADSDTLAFSLVDAPANMSIGTASGLINWTPNIGDTATSVTVRVQDGRGGADQQSYTISVAAPGSGEIHGRKFEDLNGNGIRDTAIFADGSYQEIFDLEIAGSDAIFLAGRDDLTIPDLGATHPTFPLRRHGGVSSDFVRETFPTSVPVQGGDVVQVADPAVGGIHFFAGTGTPATFFGPAGNGLQGSNLNSLGGISGYRGPQGPLAGVFLDDNNPASATPPATLDFSPPGLGVDFTTLNPELGQVFYIGDGLTTDGTPQEFIAPAGATRLFVAIPDGFSFVGDPGAYEDNDGSYRVRLGVNQDPHGTATLEPYLPDWIIYLDENQNSQQDAGEAFAVTDADGRYSFTDLPDGEFSVREQMQPGWTQTAPGGDYDVTISGGTVVTERDFGNRQLAGTTNARPGFTSTPVEAIVFGELYRYDAAAFDSDHDPLTYSLSLAPQGMTVHPTLGTVVWTPGEQQIGTHNVLLQVHDDHGGAAVQPWTVDVLNANSGPVITSAPIANAVAGQQYEYLLQAQDADEQQIAFHLEQAPAGMTIETVDLRNATGQLVRTMSSVHWDVPDSAVGTTPSVTVVAGDGAGGEARQTWTLNVQAANSTNTAPEIESTPRLTARIGRPWSHLVRGHDVDGEKLTYSLLEHPVDMTITPQGLVAWTPPADAPASVNVQLQVADGRGGQSPQTFVLQVVSSEQNERPKIVSLPPDRAIADTTYAYNPLAEDPDGDELTWSLVAAPRGLSIDSHSGTIRWTPDDQQLGTHVVTVMVSDPLLGQASQRFEIQVGCSNVPPAIVSIPPTSGLAGREYVYPLQAQDLEGDPLSWNLVESPPGMTIDDQTGELSWTPTLAQLGSHDVIVAVSDGVGSATQSYTLVVRRADEPIDGTTRGNRAPQFTSIPVFTAEADAVYQYQATAIDADGDTVSYALIGEIPNGLSISNSGRVTWTPAAPDAGQHLIQITADDGQGLTSTQAYLLDVTVNRPPQILSAPTTQVTRGDIYRYSVQASDADGDPLNYRLDAAPADMTIDPHGRILWQTTLGDSDLEYVTVTVTDDRGQSDVQSWQVALVADDQPPQVALTIVRDGRLFTDTVQVDVGSSYRVRVMATDNVAVSDVQLQVDGKTVFLEEGGTVILNAASLGDIQLQAIATDTAGLQGIATATVTSVDPTQANPPAGDAPPRPDFDPTDNQPPIVTISSPEPATTVTNLTPILGTVDDPEDSLWYYRVYMARADRVSLSGVDVTDPDWVVIHEATQEVIDGQLAVFDPSTLTNDAYAIAVVAYDANGQGFVQPTMLYVDGNVQVGNFRLEFTDLSLPLAGIPIEITRVYDTLNAADEGDFGFGWSLGVQDARIFEAAAVGEGGNFNGGNDKFIPDKTKVYLTNPAGQRVGFTYKEELVSASLFGGLWRPYFEPDPGVYDTLTIDETQVARGGLLGDLSQGINPDHYTLTTKGGLQYRYDQRVGLQTVTDRNGNVVTFSPDGVTHSSGTSIEFVRDHRDRITSIIDPAGNAITYDYDLSGDLIRVTDLTGLETRYEYLDNPAHYLDQAFDSLDRRVLKAVYEQNTEIGQFDFTGVIDALGNRIDDRDFDTEQNTGVVRDGNGNATTLIYDDRGNVLEEIDALGNKTIRQYDDPRNPDLETRIIDRRGMITDREYDERGNLLRVIERGTESNPLATPVVTGITYDSQDNVTSVTNAAGDLTAFSYDDADNVLSITNALGDSSVFTYDDHGRQASFTDFRGNITVFEYNESCPCGAPAKIIYADGTFQRLEYNQFGQTTLEETYEADGTLVERRETRYDEAGRVLEEIVGIEGDPNHPRTIVRSIYDGHLLDWEIVVHPDSLDGQGNLLESTDTPVDQRKSQITDYEYDAKDQLIRQTDAEGGVVEFRYDGAGNRILLQDPVGNITTWVYDNLNRVAEERDPFFNDGRTIAEAVVALEQPSGADCDSNTGAEHVTLRCYDEDGNETEKIDRNARRSEYDYDHAGRLTAERWYEADTDSLVRTITFSYDIVGNMLTADDPDSSYAFTYDALNRLISADNNPDGSLDVPRVVLTYRYDAAGNVIETQDDAGVTVASEYDARNRLATRRWFDADVPTGETPDVNPARVDFFYNAAGRETEIRRYSDLDGNDLVGRTGQTYDSAGRSDLLIHHDAVDDLIAGYDYDYDFRGLLIHEERSHQDAQFAQSIDYGYDLTGQLVDALFSGQDDEHYEYDANGNRTFSRVGNNERNYTTDPANQLESDGQYHYNYDGEGNLVKRVDLETGETRTFEYDHRNRLVRVDDWSSDPGDTGDPIAGAILTQSVEYTYDSLDRRIARVVDQDGIGSVSAVETFTVADGNMAWIEQTSASTHTARFLFGRRTDQLLLISNDMEVLAILADRLSTIRDTYMFVSDEVQHINSSAFGVPYGLQITDAPTQFSFGGRPYDLATRLYDLRARDLNPTDGRFLQVDPLGFGALQTNLYAYVNNSPVNATDPTGTLAVWEYGFVAGTTAAVVRGGLGYLGGEDANTAVKAGIRTGLVTGVLASLFVPAFYLDPYLWAVAFGAIDGARDQYFDIAKTRDFIHEYVDRKLHELGYGWLSNPLTDLVVTALLEIVL